MAVRALVLLLLLGTLARAHLRVENPECVPHLAVYETALANFEPWALQMFDSATKLPDGLLYGNVVQLGNFDECLAVSGGGEAAPGAFSGRWCRVVLRNASLLPVVREAGEDEEAWELREMMSLPLRHAVLRATAQDKSSGGYLSLPAVTSTPQWSVCAPSTCHAEGVEAVAVLNMAAVGLLVEVELLPDSCFASADPEGTLDSAAWGFLSVVMVLAVVAAAATICEHFYLRPLEEEGTETNRFLAGSVNAFSLRANFRRLTRHDTGPLRSLHGLRFLSFALVVLGFRAYLNAAMPNINGVENMMYAEHWMHMVIVNLPHLAVETFFLLTGLLASYAVSSSQSFCFLRHYVYRYLKLTAPLAMYVFLVATLAPRATHGPLWDVAVQPAAQSCQENWWLTLLYVNNYVRQAICGSHTWFLSVNMQLWWLAPLVLFPLSRWRRPTMAAILVLILVAEAAVFTTAFINELPWQSPLYTSWDEVVSYWQYLYVNTPMRAIPFLHGLLLGPLLLSTRRVLSGECWPLWAWVAGWLLAVSTCLAVLLTLTVSYQPDYLPKPVDSAFYNSLGRSGWALAVSWTIFACVKGHGGLVNSLLTWRGWEPLSRLTYCAFLLHNISMLTSVAAWRNPHYFSTFEVIHMSLGDLFLLAPFALALHVLVEAPVTALLHSAFGHSKLSKDTESTMDLSEESNTPEEQPNTPEEEKEEVREKAGESRL